MKTFSIDTDNNISVFATPEEAAATTTTPFDSFTNEQELTELAASWPDDRLVAIWNSLPGVKPAKDQGPRSQEGHCAHLGTHSAHGRSSPEAGGRCSRSDSVCGTAGSFHSA